MTNMYCHNCGNPIRANAKFCQSCGTGVELLPKDLVAQKAEALDLSDNIAVNNDTLIEESAEWTGSPIAQVAPPVKTKSSKQESPIRTTFSYNFTSDDYIFPSLEEELKKNLSLQREGAEEVFTDVEWQEDDDISFQFVASFMINGRENVGISSCVFVKPDSRQARRFQRLGVFKLFLKEDTEEDEENFDVYFIDFKDNYIDAARFFTVIAEEVFGYKKNDIIEFNTSSDIDPVKSIITITDTFETDISGVVMQYGIVDGISKFWFENSNGEHISDYYEYASCKMHNGLCVVKKGGAYGYGYIKVSEDTVKPITGYEFVSAEGIQLQPLPKWLSKERGEETTYIAKVNRNHIMVYDTDKLKLYYEHITPAETDWGEAMFWGGMGAFLSFILIGAPLSILDNDSAQVLIIPIVIITTIIGKKRGEEPEKRRVALFKEYPI